MKSISVKMNDDLHDWVKQHADGQERSVSAQIRFFLYSLMSDKTGQTGEQEESECQRTQLEQVR